MIDHDLFTFEISKALFFIPCAFFFSNIKIKGKWGSYKVYPVTFLDTLQNEREFFRQKEETHPF